jgi:diguanylate cyclase (GGDEF)-like protein/PAS domain S-box-containing protein
MMGLVDVISRGRFWERKIHDVSMTPALWNEKKRSDSPHEFDCLPDAIILADGQARVTYLNQAAEHMLGLSSKCAHGHALSKVLILQDRESGEPVSLCKSSTVTTSFNGAFPLLACSDGHWMPVHCSVTRPRSASATAAGGYIVSLRNARGVQAHIDRLAAQTMRDEHSQLLRRAELVKRLWRLLQEDESGEQHAFLFMDLDDFKSVNDQAGHAAGDLVIRQVASRFKAIVRERDTLARLGGDEFGLLLERCPADLARERAEQLHRAVESYALRWNGELFRVGVSIGLAHFKTHNHSLNTILARADAACYEAKRHSGDRLHIQEVRLD